MGFEYTEVEIPEWEEETVRSRKLTVVASSPWSWMFGSRALRKSVMVRREVTVECGKEMKMSSIYRTNRDGRGGYRGPNQ